MATHPKVLGLTLYPKLAYSTHILNISVQAHKQLNIMKTLTATGWGKQKETFMAAMEYASSIWSPLACSTSIKQLHFMQNAALRTATGCTQDTNLQHLHDEHSYFLYTITYSSTRHNTNKSTTSITPLTQTCNILQHSKAKKIIYLTTAVTQHTLPQTPTQPLQHT